MLSRMRKKLQGGFTLIELMIVVAIIGILAVAAIPAFVRYMRQAKTVEANEALSKIVDGASAWYQAEHYDSCGSLAAKAFPGQAMIIGTTCGTSAITPAWVPAGSCSAVAGQKCSGVSGTTNEFQASSDSQIWTALKFMLNSPHYYNYQFNAAGTDKTATFTAIACGDLTGDGPTVPGTCTATTQARFSRGGTIDSEGGPKITGIQIVNELE